MHVGSEYFAEEGNLGRELSSSKSVGANKLFKSSIPKDSRCMSEEERNRVECAYYKENHFLGNLSYGLKNFTNRWNFLNCSHLDLSNILRSTIEPIYYLSTHEGLCSHMLQYDLIWNWAVAVGRSVITFDYQSWTHYGSLSVSICDVFTLPKTFQCYKSDKKKLLLKNVDCVVVGKPKHWSTHPKNYGLKESTPICSTVNIRKCKCIAGFVLSMNTANGIYPRVSGNLFGKYTFKPHYVTLYTKFAGQMRVDEKRTVVIHWRRGDQYTRCNGVVDSGINCMGVEDLIAKVKSVSIQYGLGNFTKYLSTNENSTSNLSK